MNLSDLFIATIELLENIGAMATLILLFVHRFPLTMNRVAYGINFSGLFLFSLLALISTIPVLEAKGFTANLSMVVILLAAVHVGFVETALVGLVTATAFMAVGNTDWIFWSVGAVTFSLIAPFVLKLFNNSLSSLKLGLITQINCLCCLAYLSIYFAESNGNENFLSFTDPNNWCRFYIPLIIGTITCTMVLHWLVGYLKNHRNFTKLLVEAEIKYRSLVESSLIGIYVIQDNRLIYVNRGVTNITGISRSELLAIDNIYDHIHPADHVIVRENLQKRLTGQVEKLTYEFRLLCSNTCRYIEVFGSSFEINGNPAVIGTMINITKRKQTEEKYRLSMEKYQISMEKYQTLFNNSHDAIFVYPESIREDGRFLEVNDQSCKILGYSRDELLTMCFGDIAEPISRDILDKHYQKLLNSGNSLLEATLISKDGTRIPVETNSHYFELWDTPIILSVARDISERKQVEKALRESEERFRFLTHHIPLMVWMDDMTGQCIFVNKQWQEYTGISWEKGIDLAWENYVHPNDQQLIYDTRTKAVNPREKFSYEYRLLRSDGEYRWIQSTDIPRYNLDGSFAGYIGCCIDIHDKKKADKVLQQSYKRLEKNIEDQTRQLANANATLAQEVFIRRALEKRYRQLFDSVQDSIFVWKITPQGLPGRIIEVNDNACCRLGYSRDELLTLSILDIMSSHGKSAAIARMEKLLTARQAIFEFEHVTKDGIHIPGEVNAHLFALNGELVGLCIARDISDRKQAESELLAARNRISKTEKLAFLGNMAAGIAHEINQPLNSIKVTADSILMWGKEGQNYNWEEFLEDVQSISDQATRIANIIKYIRDLIRTSQQSNYQRFSITNAIQNAVKMTLSHPNAADISINLKLAENPLEIYGSLAHMEHVIFNLINNALEALISSDQPLKEIEIETRLEDKIIVQISDNGPGISDTVKKNIFTPFFTTKSNGMGLGMVIVKSVVTSHEGQINIANNDRGGATFRLEFPIIEADNAKEDTPVEYSIS